MTLLVFAIVVVIVAALLIWAVGIIPMDGNLSIILRVATILVAAIVIASRAGFV